MKEMLFKQLRNDAKLPEKSVDNIGWDIFCVEDDEFKNGEITLESIFNRSEFLDIINHIKDLIIYSTVSSISNPYKDMSRDAIISLLSNLPNIVLPFVNAKYYHKFSTGIASELPPKHAALLWDRSGLACNHIFHRLAGVIDSSFRGEWKVMLINLGEKPYTIKSGDKICQFILQEEIEATAKWTDELSNTTRGDKGFGSSGR